MKGVKKASVFEACIVILLLILTGLLFAAICSPAQPGSWVVNGTGKIDCIIAGSDDTLYVFSGCNLTAFGRDGRPLWTYQVPANWSLSQYVEVSQGVEYFQRQSGIISVLSGYAGFNTMILDEQAGHLYLYMYCDLPAAPEIGRPTPASTHFNWGSYEPVTRYGKLVSISGDGIDWAYTLPPVAYDLAGPDTNHNPVSVTEQGGRIYLYYDGREDVLDQHGRSLFTLSNLSAPATVDEAGNIYCVRSYRPDIDYQQINTKTAYATARAWELDGYDLMALATDVNHTIPSGTIEAYYPNGTLAWTREIAHHAILPSVAQNVWSRYDTLPIYHNGTLYVEIRNGVVALTSAGDYIWTCQLQDGSYQLFDYLPIDDDGNAYLATVRPYGQDCQVQVINRSGNLTSASWVYSTYDDRLTPAQHPLPIAAHGNLLYAVEGSGTINDADFDRIMETRRFKADTITAYDLRNGTVAWNFTPPAEDRHVTLLENESCLAELRYVDNFGPFSNMWPYYYTNETQPLRPTSHQCTQICQGGNVTYISYYSSVYEDPVIFNRSRCIYVKGFYAVSDNGSLLWSKPVDSIIDGIAANNETVYYTTRDGRIGSAGMPEVAAGVTIATAAYLFLRFFAVGAVARARIRLDQNENRNAVLQYVVDHPGSAANEIARAVGINHGTVRYHLFVLSMNHKVVTYEDGGKYLRYFKNSGAFTPGERAFLSLARREPVRKVLGVIGAKPGLSGLEISKELDISSTAAHRHLGLLVENGIIDRKPHPERGYVYTIKDEYAPHVIMISEKFP